MSCVPVLFSGYNHIFSHQQEHWHSTNRRLIDCWRSYRDVISMIWNGMHRALFRECGPISHGCLCCKCAVFTLHDHQCLIYLSNVNYCCHSHMANRPNVSCIHHGFFRFAKYVFFRLLLFPLFLLCYGPRIAMVCCVWVADHLTHWGRDKMADIFQTTFSNEFLWMKIHE